MLTVVCDAFFFIIGKSLSIKHLHEHDGSVTAISALRANAGAPVDVPMRMDAGFATD